MPLLFVRLVCLNCNILAGRPWEIDNRAGGCAHLGSNYSASYEHLGVPVTTYLHCIRQPFSGDPDCRASSSRSMQKSKEHM